MQCSHCHGKSWKTGKILAVMESHGIVMEFGKISKNHGNVMENSQISDQGFYLKIKLFATFSKFSMKIFAPQAARANLVKRDGCLLHEIIMDAPLSMTMKLKGQGPIYFAFLCPVLCR